MLNAYYDVMAQRVAIYTRISKDRHEGEGVARQEDLCRARAEREGWEVVGVFTDNDISASTRSRKVRPEYRRMLDAARAGEIDGMVAYSLSRLTRRPVEWEELIGLAEEKGVRVWSLHSGDPDLTKADGRAVARTVAAWDAAEAERTSERIRDQQAARRASGNIRTRRAFGWDGDDLLDGEAGPIRSAMADVLKGKSASEIAREWNASGVKSVTGSPWTQVRVVEILTRWRNAGVVIHKGVPIEGVTARWQPVCDRGTLERVRAVLLDSGRRTMTPGRPPTALMSSTARCGKCGEVMVASKAKARGGRERFLYRCKSALSTTGDKHYLGIERRIVDDAVRAEVRSILTFAPPSGLVPTKEDVERMQELQEARAALSDEEQELGREMGAGRISVAALRTALEGVQARREQADRDLDRIRDGYLFADLFASVTRDDDESSALLGKPKAVVAEASQVSLLGVVEVGRKFEELTITQQRQIVKRLVKVTVMPGRGTDRVVVERV